jgi:two-component system, response regulator YesN
MLLNQSKDVLDGRLNEVSEFTKQLAINRQITLQLNKKQPEIDQNVYELWNTSENIATFARTNDFVEDYYIYLNNYDTILTPNSIFYRKADFYKTSYYNNLTFDSWENEILKGNHRSTIMPSQGYLRNNKEISVVSYIQSLPINFHKQPMGTVVVLINESSINKLLENISKQYDGWSYITDQSGNYIASMGISKKEISGFSSKYKDKLNEPQFINNDTLLIRTTSMKNGWVYTAGIPKHSIMKEANKIKLITVFVLFGTLLLGLFIGLFFSYKNTRPIHSLMEILSEHLNEGLQKNKDEYEFLHGNVSKILSNNSMLKTELNHQNTIIRQAFIRRILSGEYNSEESIKRAINQANLTTLKDSGIVCMIKISSYQNSYNKEEYDEFTATRLIITQKLRNLDSTLLTMDLDADKIIVLITPESRDSKIDEDRVEKLFNELITSMNQYEISLVVSIGSLFDTYLSISKSYYEAIQATDYASLIGYTGVVWHQKLKRDHDMFYYPLDIELRFLNAVKEGQHIEANRILEQIMNENFIERKLYTEMANILVYEIRGTLLKSLDLKLFNNVVEFENLKQQIMNISYKGNLNTLRIQMKNVIEKYSIVIMAKQKSANNSAIKSIVEFLQESFSNPDLSLYEIANNVGRPEKYISQLFKEETGMYLFDYLEEIRINKAKELLMNTNMTIETISNEVGYNSPHSFRRAFKRVADVSPNQFRKAVI